MIKQTTLLNLNNQQGKVLHVEHTNGHVIEVREFNNLRWMHFGGNEIQSVMDINQPSQPQQAYSIAMLGAMLFTEQTEKLLSLGFGCGTFERFFMANMPEVLLTSVESDSSVIELAKRFFLIPENYAVINDTAENFIGRNSSNYDLVLCDVFNKQQPVCLYDSEFYHQVFHRLSENGVFVINLLPNTDSELLNILLCARKFFDWGYLLDFPDHRNILLYCLKQSSPPIDKLYKQATALSRKLNLDFSHILAQLTSLPKKITYAK